LSTAALNGGERITRYRSDSPSSTQYSDWSSARNVNDRCVHGIGSATAGTSFERPAYNYATNISHTHFDTRVHGLPQLYGTTSYYQHRLPTAGHPVTHSRPLSASTIGTQYQHRVSATHLPRSHTSESYLTSSSGTVHPRPLPSDPTVRSSSRRTCPHTAYRMK